MSKLSIRNTLITGAILVCVGVYGTFRAGLWGHRIPLAAPTATPGKGAPGPTANSSFLTNGSPGAGGFGSAPAVMASNVTLVEFFSESRALAQPGSEASKQDPRLDELVSNVAIQDIASALEFLRSRPTSNIIRDAEVRLIRRWADADSRAAADWVGQTFTGSDRQVAVGAVAAVWANRDLNEAVEWMGRLKGEDRPGAMISAAYEVARTAPLTALNLVVGLPADESRDNLIVHAGTQWAVSEPEKAAGWAGQLSDPQLRDRLLTGIATAWGDHDPAAAGAFAVNSLTPGRSQDDAIVGIVQRWVQKDPEQATLWVTQFPPGPLRDTALEEAVKLWTDVNPTQVGNWLGRLTVDQGREIGVRTYLGKIALQFPDLAARWRQEHGHDIGQPGEGDAAGGSLKGP